MASLFGKNKLRSEADKINTVDIADYVEIIKKWHGDYHHGSLKLDKETSREQAYNQDFFIRILGYEEKPAIPYSFEPKATTEKGQLPDAVLSYTDKANGVENIAAVVELKGASIPLDRPQRREGNMSPVQQGFKYKTQYRNCPFVVVSNFYESRLYHDNQLDYELWTLDDLVNPEDDYLLFKTWYTLLRKDHLVPTSGQSKTEQLLSDIRVEQENIGKKFYKVYKEARIELIRDIYRRNSSVRSNIDIGIQKAQKIIDRIVFAAFAEDRGLLPDNTLHRVIASADNSVFGGSLWNALKGFFEAIDKGSPKLEIPDGYNGGLFKFDPKLDALEIDDAPLRKVVGLGTYNFAEDLSVNILGHIFEQSISDIEEIKNKVNESQDLETLSQSRRKKDGIFYTPDYIVRYIVDNSLGAYLREHEEKFKDEFGLKGDILDKTYEKRERQAYTKYQDFLQNIKVVDPACGSGAFLVYVFDYLLAENQRVGDILGMTLFSTDTYVRDILRNNIYGVDLNEESVEITKLSLWLKTAQKGKKLTALDENIKCGNSLIDDSGVAGEKAFNWQEQFREVFKSGGFDVVVGNPPYVIVFEEKTKRYLEDKFPVFVRNNDLYTSFFGRSIEILREAGYLGLITPNSYIKGDYFKKLRRQLIEYQIKAIVDFNSYLVFEDANVFSAIITLRKSPQSTGFDLMSDTVDIKGRVEAHQDSFVANNPILDRTNSLSTFDDHFLVKDIGFNYWTVGRGKQRGGSIGDRVLYAGARIDTQDVPYVKGSNFSRYSDFVATNYLRHDWQSLLNENDVFRFSEDVLKTNPKIIYRQTSSHLVGTIDSTGAYTDKTVHTIINRPANNYDLYFVLALFNSKLLNYIYLSLTEETGRAFAQVKTVNVKKLPFVANADIDTQKALANLSKMASDIVSKQASLSRQFQQLVTVEFSLVQWPRKLEKWWVLEFADFVGALKLKLSLQQKDELLQLFEKYRIDAQRLDTEIQNTDQEINHLVYRLYGLSPEEILTVENS
jgi:type I restriction-modification system DNA methylase subunit